MSWMRPLGFLVLLGLACWGCEAAAPAPDEIRPEPAAVETEPANVNAAPAVPANIAPAVPDVAPVAPTADVKPAAGEGAGSCCGSAACNGAPAPGAPAGAGCGCRRGLPANVAAQVHCGG